MYHTVLSHPILISVNSITFSLLLILADTGAKPLIHPYFEHHPFYLELDGIDHGRAVSEQVIEGVEIDVVVESELW